MEEKQEKRKLNLINEIEIIKSRLEVGSQFPISVTDNEGNKVIFRNEDTSYPFISDNVFVVHNYLFYGLFTLDKNEDGVFPSYFIKAYGEGFKEGIKFLEKEKIDISNLDDKNRKENLIERLKRILHQRKMKNNKTIIDLVVGSVQLIWTEKNLFEAGKYNGIITAIDQFAERAGLDEKDLRSDQIEPFQFENKFDKVPEDEVYKYFYENLVKRKFLTEKQLHEYLKMAFENPKEQIKKRIDFLESPKVSTIVNIFYTYFMEVALNPHTRKLDYCKLLGEYFTNYTTKKVSDNFSRYYQKVRK